MWEGLPLREGGGGGGGGGIHSFSCATEEPEHTIFSSSAYTAHTHLILHCFSASDHQPKYISIDAVCIRTLHVHTLHWSTAWGLQVQDRQVGSAILAVYDTPRLTQGPELKLLPTL